MVGTPNDSLTKPHWREHRAAACRRARCSGVWIKTTFPCMHKEKAVSHNHRKGVVSLRKLLLKEQNFLEAHLYLFEASLEKQNLARQLKIWTRSWSQSPRFLSIHTILMQEARAWNIYSIGHSTYLALTCPHHEVTTSVPTVISLENSLPVCWSVLYYLDTNQSYSEGGNINWGNAASTLPVGKSGTLSWWVCVGAPSPLCVGPPLSRRSWLL